MSDNYLQKQERATRRREIEMSYRLRHRKAVNLLHWAHIHWNEERQDLERRIAAAEEKTRRLQEQTRVLEQLRMPCHEWVNGQVREVELPLMEVFHRLAFGCPGTDTHLGVTSVETPDAQAAAERGPVVFADPPASPDVAVTIDAQERAQRQAAAAPPTNQIKAEPATTATGVSSNQVADREATVPGEACRR